MTIHRFFVTSSDMHQSEIIFNAEQSKQISKVLRLQKGDKVIILDNNGYEYEVELELITPSSVTGKILTKTENKTEPKMFITLYQALTTKDKFELILQKCTEIGVSRFIPIETKRSLLKVKDLKSDRLERFQRIITEAAEQCERGKLPEISLPLTFEKAITQATTEGLALCAWEEEKENSLEVINEPRDSDRVAIFIGPEGGFEQEEIELAKQKGVLTVSLGPRILRTETAGFVMSAIMLYKNKDLQ